MQISSLCDDISSTFMLIHTHIYMYIIIYMYAVYIRIDITRYARTALAMGVPAVSICHSVTQSCCFRPHAQGPAAGAKAQAHAQAQQAQAKAQA